MSGGIQAVTLDCAETLLAVRFRPGEAGVRVLEQRGVPVEDGAADAFHGLMHRAWPTYDEVNRTGDPRDAMAWWQRLTAQWLSELGHDPALAPEVHAEADAWMRTPEAGVFRAFDDSAPAIAALQKAGVRLAVISNWDITLERTLADAGLREPFEFALASAPFGAEKPHPTIFQEALRRLDLPPEAVLHVGDDYEADYRGAQGAGLHALHLDRASEPGPHRIQSLTEIAERLA
jgi:REG-2-like HAD superfamily hydrolase